MKDYISPKKRDHIYQVNCKDCEKMHVGKTKSDLESRAKEYFKNIKMEKSVVAAHVCKEKNTMDH